MATTCLSNGDLTVVTVRCEQWWGLRPDRGEGVGGVCRIVLENLSCTGDIQICYIRMFESSIDSCTRPKWIVVVVVPPYKLVQLV